MKRYRVLCMASLVIIAALICGCSTSAPPETLPAATAPAADGTEAPALSPGPQGPTAFSIKVVGLTPGAALPDTYTCTGSSESPPVSWDGIPEGTKSLVLIFDDPDAPSGTFTHWIVYNMPPEKGGLTKGQTFAKVLANGGQQGDSSAGQRGYYPPCPPIGETHHYVFRLYAVDMDITMPTADREAIDWALTGHTLAETEFTTIFSR